MSIRPITGGSVGLDIADIYNKATLDPEALQYTATIHTIDHDIEIRHLISVEILKDYENNVADYILTSFLMPLGDYVKLIYPNKDNLEITLTLHYYDKTYPERYKAVIVKGIDNATGNIYARYTREELNQMDMVEIEVQCLDRLVEAIKNIPVDGIYNYTTVKDVIRVVFSKEIEKIKIEGLPIKPKIDFIPPNNEKTFRHINVPLGIRLIDLPSYLQNTQYGVYNTGIGTYIQNYGYFDDIKDPEKVIFIYPLYHYLLNDVSKMKLHIFTTPIVKNMYSEKSYCIDGDIIKVVGYGGSNGKEISDDKLINSGNAVVKTSTDAVITGQAEVTDDTINVDKDQHLEGITVKDKRDGYKVDRYTQPTSNLYKFLSGKASELLSPYQIQWNHSNPYLLYPGMPVNYIFETDTGNVVRLNGILHSHFTKYSHTDKTHITIINMLLEPHVDKVEKGSDNVVDLR